MKLNRTIQVILIAIVFIMFKRSEQAALVITCYLVLVQFVFSVFMFINESEWKLSDRQEAPDTKRQSHAVTVAIVFFQLVTIGVIYYFTSVLIHKEAIRNLLN